MCSSGDLLLYLLLFLMIPTNQSITARVFFCGERDECVLTCTCHDTSTEFWEYGRFKPTCDVKSCKAMTPGDLRTQMGIVELVNCVFFRYSVTCKSHISDHMDLVIGKPVFNDLRYPRSEIVNEECALMHEKTSPADTALLFPLYFVIFILVTWTIALLLYIVRTCLKCKRGY